MPLAFLPGQFGRQLFILSVHGKVGSYMRSVVVVAIMFVSLKKFLIRIVCSLDRREARYARFISYVTVELVMFGVDLFTYLCHNLVHNVASVSQQGRNEFKVVKS